MIKLVLVKPKHTSKRGTSHKPLVAAEGGALWKKQLLDRAEEIFSKEKAGESDSGVKDLHAKIGRLTMENDFLSVALGRIADTSAKR